jgi:hypothetical protein
MALQMKNKFEGLGDIIVRVMGQLSVPFSVEVTVPRSRHRQANITSPSMFEGGDTEQPSQGFSAEFCCQTCFRS